MFAGFNSQVASGYGFGGVLRHGPICIPLEVVRQDVTGQQQCNP
jgi:hypothetical protein